jgi:hypothetical protein
MTIRSLVDRERRHVRRSELLTGALTALAICLLVLSLGAAMLGRARWLSLPRGMPLVVWVLVTVVVVAAALRTRRKLLVRTPQHVAHTIEQEQGIRRGALVGVLELEGRGALVGLAAEGVRRSLPEAKPLAPALRRTSSRRTIAGAGAMAAALLVLVSATPVFGDGLRAMLRPIDAWTGKLLSAPVVEGAPQDLLRGSPLKLTIRAPGRRVVYLSTRQTGEAWNVDTLNVDPATGAAVWSTDVLRGDLRLVASDGRASSDSITVRAADRPFVGAVLLHARYPRYLGRADESLPLGEILHLPRGTSLTVTGRSSISLTDVALLTATGERVNFTTNGQSFAGVFMPEHSGDWKWSAKGNTGLVPDVPEALSIDIVQDSAPRVIIAEPTADTILVGTDAVELAVKATDDHGIGSIALRMVRSQSRDAAPIVRPVAGPVGTSWAGAVMVPLDSLRLAPGDAMRVQIEAVDQSPWAQRGVSRELVLRRATSEEQRTAARAMGDSAVKQAQDAAKAERSLAQRTDEAARAQGRQAGSKEATNPSANGSQQQKASMNFENAQKARNLAQDQRAMADRVEKLRQATKQLEQQLKAAGALDSSLARQLAEAQALLKQAMTPEMMAQMQKLESAAQQMNGEQSRDALRDLSQMQQRMREQLERSAEMLKRAAHEGSMQTLGDEAKELAQKERALADSGAADPAKSKQSANEAKDLADRAERLRNAMKDLKERLAKDKAEAGASKTDEASQHASKSEQQMEDAAKALANMEQQQQNGSPQQQQQQPQSGSPQQNGPQSQKGSPDQKGSPQQNGKGDGRQQAKDAAAEMDRAAKSMQDARNDQVKEWKQELTSELDRSVQEMMQLAREERSLEQKVREGQSQEDKRSQQSAVEQGVDKANERMQGEGKKSALFSPRSQRAMQDAKQKVQQATEKMTQPNGNQQQQASSLSDAAESLTKAAASLARDREKANNASSASGFSEMLKEMQQMAQKQGQINGQSQSLLSMPNGMNSQQGQSLARQLARQQRQVADQLDDAGDGPGGDRAAQLAAEARQLAETLDNGRLDPGTVARQQQLFRRLLDAGKSLEKEERDDTGKREAKSATGSDAFAPGAKVDARAAIKFRPPTWQELRGLSADERRAILDYFTRLNSGSTP